VDAFYFSVTTLTTVGLGDLSPTTTLGKLFTVIYIFAGLSLVLGFIETVAKRRPSEAARGDRAAEKTARRRLAARSANFGEHLTPTCVNTALPRPKRAAAVLALRKRGPGVCRWPGP
jgi:Ion channel